MHDIRFIRESPEAFDAGLKKRHLAPLAAELLEIDRRRRAAISGSEGLQARRKALSQQIGIAKRKDGELYHNKESGVMAFWQSENLKNGYIGLGVIVPPQQIVGFAEDGLNNLARKFHH